METYSIEYWKSQGVRIFDKLPEGWRILTGTLTEPFGYMWCDNCKSRFKPGYEHGLVKIIE